MTVLAHLDDVDHKIPIIGGGAANTARPHRKVAERVAHRRGV